MPRPAESHDPDSVERRLRELGFRHVRARKYGASVIVESGPKDHPVNHFRLRRDTVHLWRLDMADHRGRWQKTPFRAQLRELVTMVAEQFPWTLTDVAGNPARTSDREY